MQTQAWTLTHKWGPQQDKPKSSRKVAITSKIVYELQKEPKSPKSMEVILHSSGYCENLNWVFENVAFKTYLWVSVCLTGLSEKHSHQPVLLHTPVMFTSVNVGSQDKTPSVISVGEVWIQQQLRRNSHSSRLLLWLSSSKTILFPDLFKLSYLQRPQTRQIMNNSVTPFLFFFPREGE